MIRGLYTSSSAMLCETVRQDMIANNLANVDTPGFKREVGIFKELPTMVIRKVNDGRLYPPRPLNTYPKIGRVGTGAILDESYTDHGIGKFEPTGNDLDAALEDEKAYFLVERNGGVRFTRDGLFNVNNEGFLTTNNGDYVLAEPEPPNLDEKTILDANGKPKIEMGRVQLSQTEKVLIDREGRLIVNGQPRFRLLKGMATDRKAFRREGANGYVRAYGDVKRAEGYVKPGYIEKPNFSLVEEMTKMIEVSRAYEANSKIIQAHDSLLDKAVNSVGPTRR